MAFKIWEGCGIFVDRWDIELDHDHGGIQPHPQDVRRLSGGMVEAYARYGTIGRDVYTIGPFPPKKQKQIYTPNIQYVEMLPFHL